MKERYLVIRLVEALIALGTTYLALQSFFSSSVYVFLGLLVEWIFERMGFMVIMTLDASRYMPVIFSFVVFIVVVYEFTFGDELNIVSIYQINFMLFIPEALSFSRLNWFNVVDAGYILRPFREYNQVFLTGVVVMTGYSMLAFTAQYRANMRQYLERGVDYSQVEEVIANQIILSFLLGIFSAVMIVLVSITIPLIKSWVLQYATNLPFPYLILGVVASIGIIFWAILVLRGSIINTGE